MSDGGGVGGVSERGEGSKRKTKHFENIELSGENTTTSLSPPHLAPKEFLLLSM